MALGAQTTLSSEYAQLLQLEKHPVGIAVKLHYLKGLKEKVISDGGKPNAHTSTVHICFVLCAQFVVLTSSNSVRCQQSEDCHMYRKPIIQLTHYLALFMNYFCFATTSRKSVYILTSVSKHLTCFSQLRVIVKVKKIITIRINCSWIQKQNSCQISNFSSSTLV